LLRIEATAAAAVVRERLPARRAARNALRHGLAASLLNKPAMSSDAEKLARIIAGPGADNAQLGRARIIAEAELDLVRIRGLKVAVMNSFAAEANPSGAANIGDDVTPSVQRANADFERARDCRNSV
jgi:hypothetical protein